MKFGRIDIHKLTTTVINFVMLLCLSCAISSVSLTSVSFAQTPQVEEWHYTLRPGDNLQKVSQGLLNRQHTWTDLIRYNKIEQVSALAPGSIIKIPMHWLKHQPKPAVAKSVSGSALIKRASKSVFKLLKTNMNIRVGDEVATKKGNVLIEFADSSTIRLEENSNLVFNKLSHFGKTGMVDTRLRLKRGSLSTEVTPLVKGSRYEITTPSAVAAVRGTEFRLSTQGNETQLEVIEGEVSFAGEHGTTQVFAGNGARIKKGSAIIEQTKLADAPKALFAERVVDDLPSTLSWEEQKSAEAYRVQLTDNKQNGKLVKQGKIQKPELELEHIENGEYDVSMRAIDANGFEGVDSVTRIAVDIGTEQAKLIAPLAKSILDSTKPTFSWNFVKPDTLGKLQISKDKGFNLLISQTDFDAAQQIAPRKALMPGSYYWRVVSLADDGETANSEVRNFSVRGILKPVKILSVNYIDSQVGLFWNKVDNTQAYILQVSDSKSFENILKEQTIAKARAHLRLTPGKRYFARVKGIGNELFSSDFGPIKELYIENE
ncbi:hypothetical protein A3741_03520 [Oleiphilus sp. HI0069]|nr:hypothetical protein A3741_03520 [Oleiphilus sp. HI0069]